MTYRCTRFVIYKIYKYSALDCRLVLTPTLHKLWLAVGIFFLVYALTKRWWGGARPGHPSESHSWHSTRAMLHLLS